MNIYGSSENFLSIWSRLWCFFGYEDYNSGNPVNGVGIAMCMERWWTEIKLIMVVFSPLLFPTAERPHSPKTPQPISRY